MIKKKCGLIPQIFFGNFGKAAEKGNDGVRYFVAVNPQEITCCASSVKILIGGGIGGKNDVINAVQRHVHNSDLFSRFLEYSITYYRRKVKLKIKKDECTCNVFNIF